MYGINVGRSRRRRGGGGGGMCFGGLSVTELCLLLVLSWSPTTVSGKIQEHQERRKSTDSILSSQSPSEMITDQVQAVLGSIAELPCDLSVVVGDKIRLVLWSNNNNTVIYSLDAREKFVEEAQHWSNEQALGGRGYFRTSSSPHSPSLIIENVKESDAGFYKCRVDFKKSPTRNSRINLMIIVPPSQVSVFDETGKERKNLVGPYAEGSSLTLTCSSSGGWPTPRVSWWRENALLDDTWEISSEHVGATVVSNTLTIPRLERADLDARLTCQAANSNISHPVSASVSIDMNFRPTSVRILDSKTPLSADKEYTIKCESTGARPPAVMSWWRGSSRLKSHKEHTNLHGNVTTSTLHFYPTIDDSGKHLACRAENPKISGSAIEDGFNMEIHYVPQATLELGSTLNSSQIKEGSDVYFECVIKAQPWVDKVNWRHYGRLLQHNQTAGIIISNEQNLVLQNIKRHHGGVYICEGHNKEGYGASNSVILNVKYAPVCRQHQQSVYGIARQEAAKISCDVDANPETDLSFRWKFNNSAETIDIQQSAFTNDRTRSTLTYRPLTELDYGTLLCWGENKIGRGSPCVFHVIPAGKPDAVTNCSIMNQTFDSLFVSCAEGFNGGLQQLFFVEVLDFQTHSVVKNFSQPKPTFDVRNLDPGASFIVRVYAANSKGRSDTQVLQASTLKAAEKQTGMSTASIKPVFLQMTSLLAVLIGVVVTLILVAVVIVIVLRSRGHTGEDKRHPKNNGLKPPTENDKSSVPLNKKSLDDLLDGDNDKNPDVVRSHDHSTEIDGIDPDEKIFLERLNNSSRFYETIPRAVRTTANRPDPNTSTEVVNNVKNRTPRTGREEITYAELSLPNSPAYHAGHQTATLRHHRPPEPIIYAQIDPLKTTQQQCIPVGVQEQQTQTVGYPPLSQTPLPSSERNQIEVDMTRTPLLSTLHHPHIDSTGEEFVQIRPANAHVLYTNGSNMRF